MVWGKKRGEVQMKSQVASILRDNEKSYMEMWVKIKKAVEWLIQKRKQKQKTTCKISVQFRFLKTRKCKH